MKNYLFVCFCLFLFACNNPNADLEISEIRLINRNAEVEIIDKLSDVQNKKDTSKRLEISYTFSKRNISSLKSGLLQIDNNAFFQLFINGKLVLERKKESFFQDTLIAEKKDSFLYNQKGLVNYFLSPLVLEKSIVNGKNELLVQFTTQKHYKINHSDTKLFFSTEKTDFKKASSTKKLKPTRLPWVSISAKNGIKDEPKSSAKMIIKDGGKVVRENIQIEIRGNTSQSFQKKSFSFNIYSDDGNLKKVGLLNLPEHEHWILYGPYSDKSLMRNVLAYSLWEQMGYYSPKTKFCELSINGFYQGVYVLCEKIRVDTNRLNLENCYLLKIDRPKGEFFTSNISQNNAPKTVFEIKYPAINEIRISEKNAIENFVHLFEELLFLSVENNLEIFEIIDMNSFVDYLIINELCKNIDAYRLSTYFQITEHKKLVMGPVWDFNFSFGLTNYLDGYKASSFVFDNMDEVPFWWKKLNQNLFFKSALKKRWRQLRSSTLSDEVVLEMVEEFAGELEIAQENNFDKWSLLGQKEVWPNYYIGNSHREEVEYLKIWISKRAKWLDEKWKN